MSRTSSGTGVRTIAHSMVLVAGLVALPALLAAQATTRRPGTFTASVGEGAGSASFSCNACPSSRETSIAFLARVGVVVRSNLVLSLEGSGWTKEYANSIGSAAARIAFGDVVAQWYPAPSSSFFVKAGGGLSSIRDEVIVGGLPNTVITSTGPAFVLGVGWDLSLTSRLAVTPYVDFNMGTKSTAKVNSLSSNQQLGANLLHAGFAVTWRR